MNNKTDVYKFKRINTVHSYREYGDNLNSLIPNTLNELHLKASANKDNSNPTNELIMARTFTFQVTDACNLKCSYCYQINKHHNVLDYDVAKKVVDTLLSEPEKLNGYISLDNSPGIIIEFIGGEPFLQVELIDKIMDYFVSQAIKLRHPWAVYHRFSFSTNGTLYFEQRVQEFLKKWGDEISLSITIDGNKELHDSCRVFEDGSGSYDIAFNAVQDWVSKGYFVGSKITISPYNIDYLYEAIIHMYKSGYNDINANCVYEEGWTYEHAKKLYTELKKVSDYIIDNKLYFDTRLSIFRSAAFKPMLENELQTWCGGTGSMLSVDYKGLYYPCIRYMESSLGDDVPPIIIGDVDSGVGSNESTAKIIKDLKAINRRSQSTDECFYCPIADGCSYCSAYNYQVFGTADSRATYICCMHKATSLANLYFWNRIFKLENLSYYFKRHLSDEEALKIIDQDELNLLTKMEEELTVDGACQSNMIGG